MKCADSDGLMSKIHQTTVAVNEAVSVEISVSGKECGTAEGMQQRNDLFSIFHSELANFNSDLPYTNSPHLKPPSLRFVDVFIEHDHAALIRLSILVTNASLARWIASPIACRLMLFR